MRDVVKLKKWLQFWANVLDKDFYISYDGENHQGWGFPVKNTILIIKPNR